MEVCVSSVSNELRNLIVINVMLSNDNKVPQSPYLPKTYEKAFSYFTGILSLRKCTYKEKIVSLSAQFLIKFPHIFVRLV